MLSKTARALMIRATAARFTVQRRRARAHARLPCFTHASPATRRHAVIVYAIIVNADGASTASLYKTRARSAAMTAPPASSAAALARRASAQAALPYARRAPSRRMRMFDDKDGTPAYRLLLRHTPLLSSRFDTPRYLCRHITPLLLIISLFHYIYFHYLRLMLFAIMLMLLYDDDYY